LFLIHEMYLDGHIMPHGVAKVTWTQDDAGYANLPQEPGLGVEVDESQFAKVNAERKFKWPTPKAPDGAVIDY
jgi:L-alanine-DL-glutamate epimerase-like enolase superfamily enzyme